MTESTKLAMIIAVQQR